jgi:peptide/nickel transport system substrate-binding protein
MPSRTVTHALGVAAAIAVLSSAPAFAQKSKDNLRAVAVEPISTLDDTFNALPLLRQINEAIYEQLANFDWANGKWLPSMAKSWKMIDDRTIEYELRDDIVFHNGMKFTADDLVAKFNLLIDPAVKFRFKESRYGFMESAEKVGPYTVRIRAKGPTATLLARTANIDQVPGKLFLEQKEVFGRNPVSAGPYRAVQIDSGKGVVLERFDGFKTAGPAREKGKIKRIEVMSILDQQTQMARMMVNEQDFMFNVNVDTAQEMVKNPQFKLFVTDVPSFSYLQFDVANRSGIGVLRDQKVRQAMSMAINRQKIKENLLPKEAQKIPLPDGLCEKVLVACRYSAKLPSYDPAKAKALLKEAGYANGFDVTLTGWGAVKDTLTAVAGDLRAVGIRAKENYVTYVTYTKLRQEGQFQGLIAYYDNAGSQPDAENTVNFFYLPSERDYFQDNELHKLASAAMSIVDEEKRAQQYQKIFDTAATRNYVMPLLPVPSIVVYHKDLVLEGGHKSPEGFWYNYMHWAK